jgi:hypothetical protein
VVRKVFTYECGCSRGVLGIAGQPPRPPATCPDHEAEVESFETLDPATGKPWKGGSR